MLKLRFFWFENEYWLVNLSTKNEHSNQRWIVHFIITTDQNSRYSSIKFVRMKQLRNVFLLFLILSSTFSLKAQHPIGDKLEQLYDQGHYTIVYRKSKKHIEKEETKHLLAPKYYFALAGLQRSNNLYWLKRNPEVINESFEILTEFKKSEAGKQFLIAHSYELYELENDLYNWITELKQSKMRENIPKFSALVTGFFKDFDFSEFDVAELGKTEWKEDFKGVSKVRSGLATYASNYMGVPYKWGGTTAEGFDCSGFTQYVLKSAGYSIPRTAGDQYQKATKIDLENVQCGDLVFFKNDAKISHVGMILSRKGNEVKMIHASSSKGISIVEINGSEYWKKRYFACGTYLK